MDMIGQTFFQRLWQFGSDVKVAIHKERGSGSVSSEKSNRDSLWEREAVNDRGEHNVTALTI